jgi:hypothetical protein
MAPRFWLLMSSGSRKNEPKYACLAKAKASHQQRMWAEGSSSAPHFLHSGLSVRPIKWRCLRRVLYPVSRPVTTLHCVLLKDRNLTLVHGQGPEINSLACRWALPRICHLLRSWFPNHRLILFLRSCRQNSQIGNSFILKGLEVLNVKAVYHSI